MKYKVTWVIGTSEGREDYVEEHTADGVELAPNGAAFFNYSKVETIQLSTTPSEQQRPPVEVVGFVSGFTSLKKVG